MAKKNLYPVLILLSAILGCKDHRISYNEFMEMEQTACLPVPAAATRPAINQNLINRLIDESLGPYKVGPGDTLLIAVTTSDLQNQVPSVQTRVTRTGEIQMPMVGDIKVTGLEMEDVEAAIRKAYVPKIFRNCMVHAELVNPNSTKVLVIGAVTTPGLVELKRTERNLLFALVKAGGVSELASGFATLKRLRKPNEEITLNLTDPVELKRSLGLELLENGDIIKVQAAIPNTIFVGGLVRDSRPQIYPPGTQITVLQALAASGGLRTDLTPREATLIRRMAGGQDVQVKLNLDRITTGQDPNLTLVAGDILWVPYSAETRVQEWINQNIYIRGGASFSYSQDGNWNYLHGKNWNNSQGFNGNNMQNSFDPFGFLNQNNALNNLVNRPVNTAK